MSGPEQQTPRLLHCRADDDAPGKSGRGFRPSAGGQQGVTLGEAGRGHSLLNPVDAGRLGERADDNASPPLLLGDESGGGCKPSAGESALARWLLWPEREPMPEAIAGASAGEGALVEMARAQGLAPLLYYRTKKAGIAIAPAAAAALSADYYASLSRNAYLYQELARLQSTASEHGVDVVVLKGAHLAAWLYPSPGTRPMADIDLLVRREQVQKFVAALTAGDYQVVSGEPRPGAGMEFENQVLLAHPGKTGHGCVALHWSLLDFPFYLQQLRMQGFWERAVVLRDELPGMDARVLGAEDLLVYLCGHLALHHQWSRLIWLCDIALLLERLGDNLDWERTCALSRETGLTLALSETLRRTAGELGTRIPARVWTMLAESPVGPAERYAWLELTQGGRGAGRSFWASLRAMQGTRARLGFAFAHLLPSPGYMRRRYQLSHDRQLPGAYARRWLRGLRSLRPHVPGTAPMSGNTQTR